MKKFTEKYLGKKGQGMVEYALIIAFVVGIAATVFGSGTGLDSAIKNTFTKATETLNSLSGNSGSGNNGGSGGNGGSN